MANVNLKSLIGEIAETVPFHFTIEIEGLRDQGSLKWSPTWHGMDNIS